MHQSLAEAMGVTREKDKTSTATKPSTLVTRYLGDSLLNSPLPEAKDRENRPRANKRTSKNGNGKRRRKQADNSNDVASSSSGKREKRARQQAAPDDYVLASESAEIEMAIAASMGMSVSEYRRTQRQNRLDARANAN